MPTHADSAGRMAVDVRASGRITVVTLTGELTDNTVEVMGESLSTELARIPPLLVVDVRQLRSVHQCGSELLRSADRHARASGGRLIVVASQPIPGTDPIAAVQVVATVEQALSSTGWR